MDTKSPFLGYTLILAARREGGGAGAEAAASKGMADELIPFLLFGGSLAKSGWGDETKRGLLRSRSSASKKVRLKHLKEKKVHYRMKFLGRLIFPSSKQRQKFFLSSRQPTTRGVFAASFSLRPLSEIADHQGGRTTPFSDGDRKGWVGKGRRKRARSAGSGSLGERRLITQIAWLPVMGDGRGGRDGDNKTATEPLPSPLPLLAVIKIPEGGERSNRELLDRGGGERTHRWWLRCAALEHRDERSGGGGGGCQPG